MLVCNRKQKPSIFFSPSDSLSGRSLMPIYKPGGGGGVGESYFTNSHWMRCYSITTVPSHPQQFFKVSRGGCWYLFLLLSGEGHFANSNWIKS